MQLRTSLSVGRVLRRWLQPSRDQRVLAATSELRCWTSCSLGPDMSETKTAPLRAIHVFIGAFGGILKCLDESLTVDARLLLRPTMVDSQLSLPRLRSRVASLMTSLPPPTGPPLGAQRLDRPLRAPDTSRIRPQLKPGPAPHPTLPMAAAIGAIFVLTASLFASKYILDSIVGFQWPVVVYVAILALVGYGPSVFWCFLVSRRWGTGHLGQDIGLTPRWSDLGWGPLVWLGAVGIQVAVAAVVIGFGIPIANNTDGISELRVDRTYVVSIVITAVVAAPIVEEMVFRGVVMRGLRSRLAPILAVLLQAVLFGAAHIDPVRGAGNVGLSMVLAGVGLALGIGAYLLRRIGPAIVAHAIFNSVILALVLTGVAERLQDASSSLW